MNKGKIEARYAHIYTIYIELGYRFKRGADCVCTHTRYARLSSNRAGRSAGRAGGPGRGLVAAGSSVAGSPGTSVLASCAAALPLACALPPASSYYFCEKVRFGDVLTNFAESARINVNTKVEGRALLLVSRRRRRRH